MKKIKITAFVLLLSLVSTPIHAAESSRVLEIKSSNYIQRLEIFNQGSVGIPLAQVEIHAPQGNVTFSRMVFQRIGRSEYSDFGRIWATYDGERSYPGYVLGNDTITFRFKKTHSLPKTDTKFIQIFGEVKSGNRAGKTVGFAPISIKSNATQQMLIGENKSKKIPQVVEKRCSRLRRNCAS